MSKISAPRVYSMFRLPVDAGIRFNEPTLTKQSFKDDCDVNVILKRFETTGILPEATSSPQFGDFADVDDYQSALHKVMAAEDAFMSLDAKLRLRFENDPVRFVDFVSNPANNAELIALGLVNAPKPVDKPGVAASSAAPEQLPT